VRLARMEIFLFVLPCAAGMTDEGHGVQLLVEMGSQGLAVD
jgi:hypothetical protein